MLDTMLSPTTSAVPVIPLSDLILVEDPRIGERQEVRCLDGRVFYFERINKTRILFGVESGEFDRLSNEGYESCGVMCSLEQYQNAIKSLGHSNECEILGREGYLRIQNRRGRLTISGKSKEKLYNTEARVRRLTIIAKDIMLDRAD